MNQNSNSHEPLVDSALIGLDLTAEHHLANCPCCQGEREKTEQALRRFAEQEREQSSRSESFWENQASRIRAARTSLPHHAPWVTALAPALALLMVLALELMPHRKAQEERSPAVQAQQMSDHELLLAVERAMNNGTPDALTPVALVGDEMDSPVVPDKVNPKEFDSHAN